MAVPGRICAGRGGPAESAFTARGERLEAGARTQNTSARAVEGADAGYLLRNADAEQAQHPPVDTQEMGNPDTACIAFKLPKAK
jgi:hypothetical protein